MGGQKVITHDECGSRRGKLNESEYERDLLDVSILEIHAQGAESLQGSEDGAGRAAKLRGTWI